MRLFVLISLVSLMIGNSQLLIAQKHCLDFDGNDDYIEVSDFRLPANFVIEYRFKAGERSMVPFAERILSFGPSVRLEFGMIDDGESTYIWFLDQIAGGPFSIRTQEIRDNEWHHISIRYYPEQISFFIDGRLIGLLERSLSSQRYGPTLRIGAWTGALSTRTFFNGQIDEIRIWDRPVTNREIGELYQCDLTGTEPSLLAYWNFDQGIASENNTETTTLLDRSGHGKNGTLNDFALVGEESNWMASDPALSSCGTISNQQEVEVEQKMHLFPNPGNGHFTITGYASQNQQVNVYNAYGVLVKTHSLQAGNHIDLTNQPSGLYLIETSIGNQRTTVKYLKTEQ